MSIGEAPTCSFFTQYKAKCSRETLRNIRIDEHTSSNFDEADRQQVHKFYSELFKKDDAIDRNQIERVVVLRLITKCLTDQDNSKLLRRPDHKEIDKVVGSFQNEKSLGIDEITIEMLHKCWSFVKSDYYKMVSAFWDDDIMSMASIAGIIKLIPKEGDLTWLSNVLVANYDASYHL